MSYTIIMIRHAEKPGGDWPGPGLNEDGVEDPESLVIRGWQRAGGLALLFSSAFRGRPPPDRIFASGEIKQDGTGSRSKRPLQTVSPLARKLSLAPITDFSKGQEELLAAALTTQMGVTLISWQHEAIPVVARGILGDGVVAAQKWPDSRFDLVWLLERESEADPWMFTQASQQMLPADQAR